MGKNKFKSMLILLFIFIIQQLCFSVEIGTVEEPPGNFTDKDGNIVGLSVDFVKEIQKRVGDDTPIDILPGARLIKNSVERENYVIFSLSRTPAREDKYHWISLSMRKPLAMFVKKGSNLVINSLDDTRKVDSIGVMRSTVQHDFLTREGFTNIEPAATHEQDLK